MELDDGGEVGWVTGEAGGSGDVLADIVAFGWTGPEEESVLEGYILIRRGRFDGGY